MIQAVYSILDYIGDLLSLLDEYSFSFSYGVGTYFISILDIFIVAIVMTMIISIFWRGARG